VSVDADDGFFGGEFAEENVLPKACGADDDDDVTFMTGFVVFRLAFKVVFNADATLRSVIEPSRWCCCCLFLFVGLVAPLPYK